MITGETITLRVVDALDKCAIPYLLAGAFSSNQYGIPRTLALLAEIRRSVPIT